MFTGEEHLPATISYVERLPFCGAQLYRNCIYVPHSDHQCQDSRESYLFALSVSDHFQLSVLRREYKKETGIGRKQTKFNE